MTPERYQQIKQVLASAVECAPEQRASLLARACAGDEALRLEVESLLAHEQAEFIEESAFAVAAQVLAHDQDEQSERLTNQRVGPYQLVRELGRGGMGVVYEAVRADEQFEQRVAVKLIKRGMDTDAVVRRFRNERQILARLEHPNIARLLDGGTTEDGRPYFVMEYVAGLPIDRYCDEHKLNTDERLQLFRTVCAAIQFAHQNLVIHRDIKPGNVLVIADGTPKLLDFGIAKLLHADDAQASTATATALRVMTPEYASPEQIRGQPITTASDVYSLGVLLYELLTGHHPHYVRSKAAFEIAQAVCEVEPERPSTAVSRSEVVSSSNGRPAVTLTPEFVSSTREGAPERLRRRLAGDLDNIMMMALRKEPQRRYASVAQFSEDVRRQLAGLTVVAHQDTFSYRSAKFVRRHKTAVAAALLVALALVGGIVTTARQARIAAVQARLATEQRDHARLEAAKAERINAFMQTILSYADPNWYSPGRGRRGDVKVIEALNETAGRIDAELADQPEVRAELHHTVGTTYHAIGLPAQAEEHFRAALSIYHALYGAQHPKIAENLYYLGAVMDTKADYAAAESIWRQAIMMMRAVDKENVNLPYMLQDLGGMLASQGKAEGETMLNEALGLFRRHYGEDHITVVETYDRFGLMYEARGELNQAQAMFEEALARTKRLPEVQAATTEATALLFLGRVHRKKGEYAEAEALYRQSLDLQRKASSDNQPSFANTLIEVATLHSLMRDYAQAEHEAGSALEIYRRRLPEENPLITGTLSKLGVLAVKAGQPGRARSYLLEALGSYHSAQQKGTPNSGACGLGELQYLLGRYAEAEALSIKCYDELKAHYGEQSPDTIEARQRLVALYEASKKPTLAQHLR